MSEDIKMTNGSSLSIPKGATHLLGDCFAKWIDNNCIAVIGNYQGATWCKTDNAMPRNAIDFSELSLLREKQALTQQVAELRAELERAYDALHKTMRDYLDDTSSISDSESKDRADAVIKALKESE